MSKEDIEILEEFVEEYKNKGFYGIIKVEKMQAFKNILLDYKQKITALDKNEKFIKELGKEIDRLQEENKELMKLKKDHSYSVDIVRQNTKLKYELLYSIPKERVIKILEKEELPNVIVGGRRNSKTLEYGKKLGRIELCKELLKDGGE